MFRVANSQNGRTETHIAIDLYRMNAALDSLRAAYLITLAELRAQRNRTSVFLERQRMDEATELAAIEKGRVAEAA